MKIVELVKTLNESEDRISFLARTYAEKLKNAAEKDRDMRGKTPEEIVQFLSKFDPNPHKKSLNFLVKSYSNGEFRAEDRSKIRETLNLFYKVVKKLENKDILSYKTLRDLLDALEPFETKEENDEALTNRQIKKMAKSEVETLIDTPNFKVIIPKTEKAAQIYGAGTKWCTAGTNDCRFNEYNSEGPLYIIIAKNGNKTRKFQLHYESGQFMDEKDTQVSKSDRKFLSGFPQYKEFLEYLITKHYSKYIEDENEENGELKS